MQQKKARSVWPAQLARWASWGLIGLLKNFLKLCKFVEVFVLCYGCLQRHFCLRPLQSKQTKERGKVVDVHVQDHFCWSASQLVPIGTPTAPNLVVPNCTEWELVEACRCDFKGEGPKEILNSRGTALKASGSFLPCWRQGQENNYLVEIPMMDSRRGTPKADLGVLIKLDTVCYSQHKI